MNSKLYPLCAKYQYIDLFLDIRKVRTQSNKTVLALWHNSENIPHNDDLRRYVRSVQQQQPNSNQAANSLPRKNKLKKATQEKRQERKAAKTLSAILLVFILTWTPYNVLAVMKGILGPEQSDKLIPEMLWHIAYCLCYINSTINPFCYALCNAAFRRTYIRILTCKWRSSQKQPVNTYYYG